MKRISVLALIGCLLLLMASPAMAQRDPFDPSGGEAPSQNQSGNNQNQGSDEEDDETEPAVTENETEAETETSAPNTKPNRSEVLPFTGSSTESWFVLAYALVVLGLSLLAYNRLGPPAHSRSRRRH